MTSGGKLRGIIPALSHSALSLVHVQDGGQRGCLALLASTTSRRDVTRTKPSHGDLPSIFRQCAMLRGRARPNTPCKVKVALSPPTGSFPLSAPACYYCCLEAERRRLAARFLFISCAPGFQEKNRRNPPKSTVITPQPGAHRSTCPCVIKVEKQEGEKNQIKLAPQWLRCS